MILWEKSSLDDREAIFEFLYEFNPLAAEKADAITTKKVEIDLIIGTIIAIKVRGIMNCKSKYCGKS